MRNAGAAIVGLAVLAAVIGPCARAVRSVRTGTGAAARGAVASLVRARRARPRHPRARPVGRAHLAARRSSWSSVSASIGTVMGSLAGYYGGIVDEVISRVIDILLAFPGLLLAIALVAVLGPSLTNVVHCAVADRVGRIRAVVRAAGSAGA